MAGKPQEPPKLEHEVRDGILYLTFSGTFTEENIEPIVVRAAELIRVEGNTWDIISDLRRAFQGDRKVTRQVSEFVKGNRPYTRRSAIIISSGPKRFFFDIAVRLSGRKDMRPFTRIEDAEAWIREA